VVLILGTLFGHFYRKIEDVGVKKLVGTAFGLVIVFTTSNFQSLHFFISVFICYLIIKVNER
jgi:hypothetical protein